MDDSRPPSSIAGGRFLAQKRLGNGAFAQIWRGCDTSSQEQVAIKFEDYRKQELMLEDEAELLRDLSGPARREGFAQCFHYSDEGPWQCLVMELLGLSLEDQLQACGGKLPPPSVVLVAEQALRRLEYLHSKGYIHRDIKPENFLFGLGERVHHLYLIDFGLSKRYWTREGHEKPNHKRAGWTCWHRTEPTPGAVLERKEQVEIRDLCKGLPRAYRSFLSDVREYGFSERPAYGKLRELFQEVREEHGPPEDHQFAWLVDRPLGPLVPWEVWDEDLAQPDDLAGGDKTLGSTLSAMLAAMTCSCSNGEESEEESL